MGFKINATGDAAKIVAVILSAAFVLLTLGGIVIWQNGKTRDVLKTAATDAAAEAVEQALD
jgi:cytochrome b subunit of formate dehydrogenase